MAKRKQAAPKRVVKKKPAPVTSPVKIEDEFKVVSGPGYCVLEAIGGRDYMEDRTAVTLDKTGLRHEDKTNLFAVFDGHGGSECAEYCKKNMFKDLKKCKNFESNMVACLTATFVNIDTKYAKKAKKEELLDGSTATVVAIRGGKIFSANVGDSRAIVVRETGRALALTRDHNGELKDEHERIKKEKGEMLWDSEGAVFRVCGVLAVTRAIGDTYLPCVTGKPETNEVDITEKDTYLLIASDGIWDEVKHGEASKYLNLYGLKEGIIRIAKLAIKRGSEDNISLVAVDLKELQQEQEEKENDSAASSKQKKR
uniref:PPM-type phosphatase domain-containing protein n=1 Tax=Aplanochytrium stocchinoi TaxID=215587 RepID=A0A6S8G0Q5_9STRA|mmetsp:Transcript_7299/g.9247  ORF Transcript_7299/g.9247 Transcript_7299/m.9247 type:complete len:312 (+) Transcript_7299:220-1155(+)